MEIGATAWVYTIEETIVRNRDFALELDEGMQVRFPILMQLSTDFNELKVGWERECLNE